MTRQSLLAIYERAVAKATSAPRTMTRMERAVIAHVNLGAPAPGPDGRNPAARKAGKGRKTPSTDLDLARARAFALKAKGAAK